MQINIAKTILNTGIPFPSSEEVNVLGTPELITKPVMVRYLNSKWERVSQ